MRLSEDIRQCVVFLGWQKPGPVDTAPIDPKGTGFFVVDEMSGEPQRLYLVTARHVAKKLTPPFVVRVNRRDGTGGGLVYINGPADIEWCYHPDETVDLAVAPFPLPIWADCFAIESRKMSEDLQLLKDIDAGDAACVIGLYEFVHGTKRNLPITHVGHVAMLPRDELVPVDGTLREVYLVQANAISGCSGSPVFTIRSRRFPANQAPGRGMGIVGQDTKAFLLGVWSASWKVKGSDIIAVRLDDDDPTRRLAPLGMGIVTPLPKLIEILWSDELKQASDRVLKKIQIANGPTEDMASGRTVGRMATPTAEPGSDNPRHKEDFRALVNAAVKKKPRA